MSPREPKLRLDQLLVDRGLVESRNKAQGLIMAGQVRVRGERVDKAGTQMSRDADVELAEPPRFVSRGGLKLEGALDHFHIDPSGLICIDVGASTGGFTDCLLQRGAAMVYAVDVGRGQLHDRVARDQRVAVKDKTNVHYRFELPQSAGLATIDVSFISLTQVLPNVLPHLSLGGRALCLVKPQFEAGRDQVGRGGVVKDPLVHGAVLAKIGIWAVDRGIRVRGLVRSIVVGAAGNVEYFALLEPV
jgi:23S rRNA (cytidine1920-2'-O)/16S rRNA (cytidine1409-2'-O)-methyltransferase